MGKLNGWKTACAVWVLGAASTIALPAQTFTTLHSFDGTDGAGPFAGLVQATDGNLYGTAYGGGPRTGYGTVFKVTPGGTLTTLYSFCSQSGCTDGANPLAALVQATNGNFYGTTYGGGANGDAGTVFKITGSGGLTTRYSFCSQVDFADGAEPEAALVQATDGNFYGTTYGGGANAAGTVFKIIPSGAFSTLYSFCSQSGCTDGASPVAALVQASDGSLYGTTFSGGTNRKGTVFRITPRGTLTTLYSFCSQTGCTDGSGPAAALVQAAGGSFYGTTSFGGAKGNYGTVFKVTPSGTLTTLNSFSGGLDGAYPAGLVLATDGNLYGTTYQNGAHGYGTVFKITSSGRLTTLYSFCSQSGCADGGEPVAALAQETNGKFYGTTNSGGANGYGTVFSLSAGLGPFVETVPTSGKVGAAVKILGTNLTGATSVSFNGTAATFKVVSSSEITTTVPAAASTGKVKVVTPRGTLSSNVAFRVTPTISSFSPTSGPVGTSVTISGESLTGATSVTFGGVKATSFTVGSNTEITATVPTGAKTGRIGVTTPGGAATSTGTFTVN